MRFASFLPRRGEPYGKLERAAKAQEAEGSELEWDGESDDAVLLCKTHYCNQEEELHSNRFNLTSRLRTLASPWRRAAEPLESTMNLVIRRMDNTTFVVEVRKKAAILDLREAIEKKFEASDCQVSWPHVWGYFCLTFRDQKLLDEHLLLCQLGIEDLDELVFVRHLNSRRFKDCQQKSFFARLRRKHRVDRSKC